MMIFRNLKIQFRTTAQTVILLVALELMFAALIIILKKPFQSSKGPS